MRRRSFRRSKRRSRGKRIRKVFSSRGGYRL
jgi:hypothetical protein